MLTNRRLVVLLVVLAAWAVGCPNAEQVEETDGVCVDDDTRCNDAGHFDVCSNGEWQQEWFCPRACNDDWGCSACDPAEQDGLACDGADVVECLPSGLLGGLVDDCSDEEACYEGKCQRSCTADGVDVIYVVDRIQQLISFDPRKLESGDNPFEVIGTLRCQPQYGNVPGWGGSSVTPFSMSVDRQGKAWVLYTSGEIFHADITNAACEPSNFTPQQSTSQGDWLLFGMGFATDVPEGDTEHLYLAGGASDPEPGGMFGVVDSATLQVQTLGTLPTSVENSPEFTGTGNAELFAYFPGVNSKIKQLDRSTGLQIGPDIDAGSIAGGVQAWAFAHWGGKFFIFVTDGTGNSTVRQSDLETGAYEGIVKQNLPYVIVGAGVSTCAPLAVGD